MKSRNVRLLAAAVLGALAAAAGWTAAEYQRDITRARNRVSSGSRVLTTPCGAIEYAEMGKGPVILSVHGAGGGFDQGLAIAAPFVSRGYRVIAMSRFGYLHTPVPAHASIALQADAHACLLDALGIRSAAVLGVSAGAPSSLEFALRYPERCTALVLIVPGWYPSPEAAKRLAPLAEFVFSQVLRSDFLYWAMNRFLPALSERMVLGTPPEVVAAASASERARVASVLEIISPLSQRQEGLSLEVRFTIERLSKPLETISAPTLTISTEDDLYRTYDNARFIAQHVAHGRFIGYPTGGHLFVGHNDEVLAAVEDFLGQTRSGGE